MAVKRSFHEIKGGSRFQAVRNANSWAVYDHRKGVYVPFPGGKESTVNESGAKSYADRLNRGVYHYGVKVGA